MMMSRNVSYINTLEDIFLKSELEDNVIKWVKEDICRKFRINVAGKYNVDIYPELRIRYYNIGAWLKNNAEVLLLPEKNIEVMEKIARVNNISEYSYNWSSCLCDDIELLGADKNVLDNYEECNNLLEYMDKDYQYYIVKRNPRGMDARVLTEGVCICIDKWDNEELKEMFYSDYMMEEDEAVDEWLEGLAEVDLLVKEV
jgi:hypothetical protein